MNNNNFAILINTTDNFEDCWIPFFTLFKKYWPDYSGKIYLNTETKIFKFPGLDIISIQNNQYTPDKKITWSECLFRGLNSIDSNIILYMQEDYFIKDVVKNDLVKTYVQIIQDNNDIDCIHLTDQAVIPDKKSEKYEGLYSVLLKQRYRISCQAALWRKETLIAYIRTNESAWQFEEFGSKRAAILNHVFYVVDKNWIKLNQFEIIPYIFTGIVRGRWNEEVIPLFEWNNLKIDYSLRGFLKDTPERPFKFKVMSKLKRFPIILNNYFDLIKLKK